MGESTGGEPPRDRSVPDKAATQTRILDAAASLFLAHGIDGTSVARIAELAGVSRGAIFWHFGSKAGLVQDAWRHFLVPFRNELAERAQHDDPRKRILELFDAYEQFVATNRDPLRGLVQRCLESPELRGFVQSELLALHETFVRDVREALSALVPPECEIEALAVGMVSLLDGNLLLDLLSPDPPPDARRQHAARAVLERLCAPRGGR